MKYIVLSFLVGFLTLISCEEEENLLPINYSAQLTPLNNSGVSGTASITVAGDSIYVTISAGGLVANEVHPQHFHGLGSNSNAVCPPQTADLDNDGVISVSEGELFYGTPKMPLEEFPVSTASGTINFTKGYKFGSAGVPDKNDLEPLDSKVIVLHGMMSNGNYEATLPVACGQVTLSPK